jgi:hypothetical protein
MKRNVLLRARSLGATIARVQPSPVNSHSPTKFSSSVSSETEPSRPEPANRQPKPFFRQWLDIWQSRNAGVRP